MRPASGQQVAEPPRWDAGVSVGLLSANPASPENTDPYGRWYHETRYALSIGRYWSEHLKTELEAASSTEGSRYSNRYAMVPGVPPYYPLNVYENFRLSQVSGRVVWQFLENRWIHPYVFGGVTYDALRQHSRIAEQYYIPDPRSPSGRIIVSPETRTGPATDYHFGGTAGVGAKFYVSPNAYFNAAFLGSRTNQTRSLSLIAGLGVDF